MARGVKLATSPSVLPTMTTAQQDWTWAKLHSTRGLKPDTERPLAQGETNAKFIQREWNENPTLSDLATAALTVLNQDPDGFWLMIEGGDIDWSAHDNHLDNLIGTTLDFDRSVGTVINWIENTWRLGTQSTHRHRRPRPLFHPQR